jgi:hypothetical protein
LRLGIQPFGQQFAVLDLVFAGKRGFCKFADGGYLKSTVLVQSGNPASGNLNPVQGKAKAQQNAQIAREERQDISLTLRILP